MVKVDLAKSAGEHLPKGTNHSQTQRNKKYQITVTVSNELTLEQLVGANFLRFGGVPKVPTLEDVAKAIQDSFVTDYDDKGRLDNQWGSPQEVMWEFVNEAIFYDPTLVELDVDSVK